MRVNSITAKIYILLTVLPVLFGAAGCGTMDYTAPLEGRYVTASHAVKDFEVIGLVSVSSAETHRAGPFGFVKTVEGSKVTYSDLMQEAALIEADDIIDVRIDIHAGKAARFAERLTGWERVFAYTGKALAIKYVSKSYDSDDIEDVEDGNIDDDGGGEDFEDTSLLNR
jgi:hypothetical protein